MPRISSDYATFIPKLASSNDLAGMLNGVLTLLMVPVVDDVGTGLVESDMKMMTAMYAAGWTGHSERATVTSVLAAAGYSQEDRAYLGRWAAGSSEEYVRTYRAVIRRLTVGFVHVSTTPGAYETFDEAEAYEAVRDRLRAGGAAPNGVDSECEVMKERARTILAAIERESEKDSKAMTPTTPRYNAAVVSAPVAGVDEGDDAEEMQEEDWAFFVLAFDTRRKTTTLHWRKGCYRGRRLLFKQYQLVFEEKPAPGSFTTTCRSCWPTQAPAANGPCDSEEAGSTSSSTGTDS